MSIKKISSLAGAFIVVLSLTGCGGEKVYETTEEIKVTRQHAKNRIGSKQDPDIVIEKDTREIIDDSDSNSDMDEF